MGIATSKSPLERRNTVARRSQRRTIHTIKSRVDKVFPDIKKFKGVTKNEHYHALYAEIEHLKYELAKKSKDLQPQIRNVYSDTLKRIEEAFTALDGRLNENQEKAIKKEREREEKAEKKKEKKKNKEEDVTSENNDVEVQEIEEEATNEANNLEQSTEKRKTVELKFVQVIPDEVTQVDVHNNNNNIVKSAEEKRKSILKHGVAVMPGAMLNEIAARTSNTVTIQEQHKPHIEHNSEKINVKINEIIENLQASEYQIADFVGKRNGTQYNRIKEKLNHHLTTLSSFSPSDDYTLEQIKICTNYVHSCLNFLDEKAIEEEKLQDDVFFPAKSSVVASPVMSPTMSPVMSPTLSPSLSPIDARNKYEKLSKTTAI